MAIRWEAEACDLAPDPVSGAAIRRLTSAPMTNVNIYFEQPFGTPDGRRFAYARANSPDPRLAPTELRVADLTTLKVAHIDSDIASNWFATSSWSGKLHYVRTNGELIRVDLTTLEKQIVLTHWPLPLDCYTWSVTPDMKHIVVGLRPSHYNRMMHQLYLVNLETGDVKIIYESEYPLGHVQIQHVTGRDILIQHNVMFEGKRDATHFVLGLHGDNERPLKIAGPYTATSTGHASWVGDTGRMATPVACPGFNANPEHPPEGKCHDPRHPQGNMVIVGPGEEPQVFEAPEHIFNHGSMSKCGRYFVAESFRQGTLVPAEIVVGNIETGKYRTLVSNTGSQGGGPASSHVHAYFTADSGNVIYNANPYGLCHLHAAKLPDDFLSSLD